jgi:ATP-dependent exoDNAse (exonuclease V) alpha subunit
MQGRIINIYEENKEAIIDFDLFSEPIKVRKSLTHDIELAYSISVHKSQ